MSYQQFTNVFDTLTILDLLKVFASNEGFTVEQDVGGLVDGLGNPQRMIRLTKNGKTWHFVPRSFREGSRPDYNSIVCFIADAPYDQYPLNGTGTYLSLPTLNLPANGQNQVSCSVLFRTFSSFPNVYMFGDGNQINVVIETSTGVFAHLSFGIVDKFSTWGGGHYLFGCLPRFIATANGDFSWNYSTTSAVNYPFSEIDGGSDTTFANVITSDINGGLIYSTGRFVNNVAPINQHRLGIPTDPQDNFNNPNAINSPILQYTPSAATLVSPLLPIYIRLNDNNTMTFYMIGHFNSVRATTSDVYTPAQIINYGGVDWQIFPFGQKTGVNTENGATMARSAVAYRIVP